MPNQLLTDTIASLKYTLAEIEGYIAKETANPSKGQCADLGGMMVGNYESGDYKAEMPGLTPSLYNPACIRAIRSMGWHDGNNIPRPPTIHTYLEWLEIKAKNFRESIELFENAAKREENAKRP